MELAKVSRRRSTSAEPEGVADRLDEPVSADRDAEHAAHDHEHRRERDDEGRQPGAHDDQAVDRADQRRRTAKARITPIQGLSE